MTEEVQDQEVETSNEEQLTSLAAEHKDLIRSLVADQLKPMKGNMDRMVEERNNAIRELERLREQAQEAEVERLKESGKEKEALEMRLASASEKNKLLQERIDRLTRDHEVSAALAGYEFRNSTAQQLAKDAVLKQLIKDSDGNWVHKTGASILEFTKTFLTHEDQEFLLKPKLNSGGGGRGGDAPSLPDKGPIASLKGRTPAEILELVKQGRVRGRG